MNCLDLKKGTNPVEDKKGGATILRRLLRYCQKQYQLEKLLGGIKDGRKRAPIKTEQVVRAVAVMLWSRMGSLNALEQTQGNAFWKRWVTGKIGSADTQGRVFSRLDCTPLRENIKTVYRRMRRSKVLGGSIQGVRVLVIDGHEQSCSYRRRCGGCMSRRIGEGEGERLQYYHRHVSAMLVCGGMQILLDVEMQRQGEDEVATATRLLVRVLEKYPRAFEVVCGDGLYAQGRFFKLAIHHGKEILAVLKDDRRDLMVDAMGLFATIEPVNIAEGKVHRQMWDEEGFTSWEGFGAPVRVVRCLETQEVRRQIHKKIETKTIDWVWVTTLAKEKAKTETVIQIGHRRWAIENEGFNELVNEWHADHIYKHHPNAIEAFWLLLMFCYNLFHAFIERNLKPQIRLRHTMRHWARIMASEIYHQQWNPLAMRAGP